MGANATYDGMLKVAFVPTIANIAAPTVAEITAGDDIQGDITPDGLATPVDTAEVDQSSLDSTQSSSAAGRRKVNPSITFKRFTKAGVATTAESILTYQAEGFLVVRRTKASSVAWAAADKVEVYPVELGEPSPSNPAPNEVQKATVTLFTTADFNKNAVVAA